MNYDQLLHSIVKLHESAQAGAAAAVNRFLVIRNWLMGGYIVEFEQRGADRARYGQRLMEQLASDLALLGIRGLSPTNLRLSRLHYSAYPQIRRTVSGEFKSGLRQIQQKLSVEFPPALRSKAGAPARSFAPRPSVVSSPEPQPAPRNVPTPLSPEYLLRFSWSHFVEFLRLDEPWKRAFYENQCLKGNWSVRQLQRQIGALLYERTGLSTNKRKVIERARAQGAETPSPVRDLIRDPYVLEFTGLAERADFNESELEAALLDHLQAFLLELGTGFCFEARQMRITLDNEHDYVDLVFYHRILRFHLLLDLKVRPFKHGDAGQMNFYLNYFKNRVMAPGDHPPVGIILCSDRRQTKVEFATAGMDNRLFVSRYLVALPKPEQLEALIEADRAQFESATRDAQACRRGKSRRRSRAGRRGEKP